jgi:hypothetical protein
MIARIAILIVSIAAVLCAAAPPVSHAGLKTPLLFDEFGVAGHCALVARLENFVVVLQDTPGSIGYVFAYGPDVEGPSSPRATLVMIKDYLVNSRGLPARRIKTIYGGRNQVLTEPKTQLWIVPAGASAPEPQKYETNIETFKGMFAEDEPEDYIALVFPDEMGPGIGRATEAAFVDMLQQQKKAIAYIVAYQGEDALPGAARRAASDQIEHLKSYKVDASRIKTVLGGARKKTTVQLWILPPGDPAPAADAGTEQPLRKNVKISSENDLILAAPANERAVFNRVLDVLRTQPTLKAYVIVTLQPIQPESAPDPETEAEEQPRDLPKMIQKWREELTNTHKIRADRFIVVFTTAAPDEGGNYVEVWAIAPGQPFPDPDDEPEGEPSDVVQDPERRP